MFHLIRKYRTRRFLSRMQRYIRKNGFDPHHYEDRLSRSKNSARCFIGVASVLDRRGTYGAALLYKDNGTATGQRAIRALATAAGDAWRSTSIEEKGFDIGENAKEAIEFIETAKTFV